MRMIMIMRMRMIMKMIMIMGMRRKRKKKKEKESTGFPSRAPRRDSVSRGSADEQIYITEKHIIYIIILFFYP